MSLDRYFVERCHPEGGSATYPLTRLDARLALLPHALVVAASRPNAPSGAFGYGF